MRDEAITWGLLIFAHLVISTQGEILDARQVEYSASRIFLNYEAYISVTLSGLGKPAK